MSFKILKILLIVSILFISCNIAFASDNATDFTAVDVDDSVELSSIDGDASLLSDNISTKACTQIEANEINSYYKEKSQLVSYLKDANGTPIKNKQLTITLNGKDYNKTTDSNGKVSLDVNLKPNTYNASVKFLGDDDFTSSQADTLVKIEKTPLAIKISNFKTYSNSKDYFKAKIYNKITKNPVAGIRVAFKVYSSKTKKYTYYYATTDKNGMATLNKNLKVGSYKILVLIKDSKNKDYISYKYSKTQATMKVTSSGGEDCCSFYLQVSDTEAVGGFRRDNTAATTIKVQEDKINGLSVVKHSNANGFVHLIVFSNGWMAGNGGLDSWDAIKNMQNWVSDMVKSNKIKMSLVKKIYHYKRSINFGHFAIKAPNGEYAVAWKNKIITGKLKPGEFLCTPNFKEYYRHSTYGKYSKDPAKAAIKVGATDKYGVNRRQVVVLHWKATTDKNYKTTSSIKCYAANDNGRFVGVSSGGLVDTVKFKNRVVSGHSLPRVPNMKYLGDHKFGNIDKLIKTQTTVKAPNIANPFNTTNYFKVTVKNKQTKKAVKWANIKIKLTSKNGSRTYTVKTDKNGIAKLNTKSLNVGVYNVVISPANNKYIISGKSKITINENYVNETAVEA
jgi:hypothetical protein